MLTFNQMIQINNAAGAEDYSSSIVHYTSERNLFDILSSGQLWFGRVDQMNDATEYTHYWNAVSEVASEILPNLHPEIIKSALAQADGLIRNSAYISSWCEYDEALPEGSLQMWRAYGDNCRGVAAVVDSSEFQPSKLTPNKLNFFVNNSKVQYVRRGDVKGLAASLLKRVRDSRVLSLIPNAEISFAMVLAAKAPTSKHVSFQEEKEIRFLILPRLLQAGNRFCPVDSLRTISREQGEREFFALDLNNWSDYDFDLRLSKILKKVLVGPLGNPTERARRVRKQLDQLGLQHVPVEIVDIPLRDNG